MTRYSQKEAVFSAIMSYMHDSGVVLEEGVKIELSSDVRKTVVEMITSFIENNKVDFSAEASAKYNTTDKIRVYATGLLSNWLRKDSRLNGGEKHDIKRPGLRTGQNDAVVKTLKAIRKILTESIEINLIDAEISQRIKEITQVKNSKIQFNADLIPSKLTHLINKQG